MKKAQWKKDPRERTFGKDPREVLNDELTAALKKANDIIQDQNRRVDWLKGHLEQKQEQARELYKFREAYMRLRAMGVVVTHDDEFKHLQGEDMDAFFKMNLGPKTPTSLEDLINEKLKTKFQKAYQQALLYGNSATQVFYDDKTDTLTWLPPQKP